MSNPLAPTIKYVQMAALLRLVSKDLASSNMAGGVGFVTPQLIGGVSNASAITSTSRASATLTKTRPLQMQLPCSNSPIFRLWPRERPLLRSRVTLVLFSSSLWVVLQNLCQEQSLQAMTALRENHESPPTPPLNKSLPPQSWLQLHSFQKTKLIRF